MNVNGLNSVLIADDEPHIRMMLRKLMESMGIFDIREASDGLEACRMYGDSPSDFVVMDINMPRMTGLEALKAITDVDPEAVIIMLTSIGTRQAVETSVEHGACFYIRKDTPLKEIREKLENVLEEVFGDEEEEA